MIQKAYTETSIGQCHYRFREGEGTPIVFLHQTPSSSLMYEEIIQLMPQNTCIAIDTPGFGMSDDISGNPNVADYGQSIIEALINIKIGDFHLLGHHSGASIALYMENEFNHMVSSLTLIGAFLATKEEKELMKNQTGLDWSPKEDGTHQALH